MISTADQTSIIRTANLAADAAAKTTLAYFRSDELGLENKAKADFDPVTFADREAEKAMRAILAEARPDDAVMGEEFGFSEGTSGITWVLDPIDGTRGYVSGTPTWGTLIAASTGAGPVFGIVDQPYTGERFSGGFGQSHLTRKGQKTAIAVRPASKLDEAILFTTFPEVGSQLERDAFLRVDGQTKLTRYGMDCYAYALLASGHVDLVIEAGLHAYDIQAPIALIEAAGGIVTDWQGGPAHEGGQVVAAASKGLHDEALRLLAG